MNLKTFLRKKLKRKKTIYYVSDNEGLKILDQKLAKSDLFALDTEFDWRTTYFPKLSLIQISLSKQLFLIDIMKVNPERVLKKFLEDERYLKIFHSVRSDTTVLSKCLGSKTKNVFDIQIADKILSNGEIESYGKIVKKFFFIDLKKTETNSNWLKRPLTQDQVNYALEDVDYLLEIFYYQKKELLRKGLLNEVLQASSIQANLGNQSLKKLRLKKQEKKLTKRDKEIFKWREELAEAENVPPAYIFNEKQLKILSKIDSKDNSARKKIMKIIGDNKLSDNFISKFL